MRLIARLGALGLVITLSLVVAPRWAAGGGICGPGEQPVEGADGSIECVKTKPDVDPEPNPGGGNGGSDGGTPLPDHRPLWTPYLSVFDGPGGPETCIDTFLDYSLGRDPTMSEEIEMERRFFLLLRGGNLICPDAEIPDGTTPGLEAADLYRRIPLPAPTPYVQPGSLPVGLDAYLETGAAPTGTYGPDPTPFGDLYLELEADIYVDWDDPHDDVDGEEGPYRVATEDGGDRPARPGPHPDGEIFHLYQHDGFYEITVRYEWRATWSLGGDSGVLTGISTSGVYPAPGFEVFSRQAVG